jgi:hypothetical protein
VGLHSKVNVSSASPDVVSPGSLRIWQKSTTLSNYQLEFVAQIERKSLSWAYRATDEKNYYATKLVMTRPGPQPNAGLVRYLMLNGHEWDRVQMPLPLTLERGASYKVRVSVQDDRFITYVNGQVVSSVARSAPAARRRRLLRRRGRSAARGLGDRIRARQFPREAAVAFLPHRDARRTRRRRRIVSLIDLHS